jgi:nicotinamidase-related amidase
MKDNEEGRATAPYRDQSTGGTALLIIDMINCFDFPGAERLEPKARTAAERIATLRSAVEDAGHPVIYVNDNFGEWHSDASRLVEQALAKENAFTAAVKPAENDYFVIKPQFSGFYATNLPVLLPKLGVSRLILTGIATDICVLFTAADAHMRDYRLWVPEDAVAAEDDDRGKLALSIMRETMAAETASTTNLTVDAWIACLGEGQAADRRQEL